MDDCERVVGDMSGHPRQNWAFSNLNIVLGPSLGESFSMNRSSEMVHGTLTMHIVVVKIADSTSQYMLILSYYIHSRIYPVIALVLRK